MTHAAGAAASSPRRPAGAGAEPRTYYDRPVVKEPEWTWEVPWYLFAGGTAGVASTLGAVARRSGDDRLADAAALVGLAGAAAGPVLLVKDLGRPRRFLNMLRVFKPTSAMSMGSWVLAAYGAAAGAAGALGLAGRWPRLHTLLESGAGILGLPMATYTGVLLADTSIPVWREARTDLPRLFAASAAATGGAALVAVVPPGSAAPARRLAVGGAVIELALAGAMERRLGEVGRHYDQGRAGQFAKAARACTASGAALIALGGRRRPVAVAGAGLLLAGGVCLRWSVFRAGFQSAADPLDTTHRPLARSR